MTNKTIDINESTIKQCVEYLRPEDLEIRKQVDMGYTYDGKTVVLFEIRPQWDNPQEKDQIEFAKIRYYKSKKEWHLYWMRASGNWELYQPFPKSSHLQQIIDVIKKDENACFLVNNKAYNCSLCFKSYFN